MLISDVSRAELRDAVFEIDGPGLVAIVQVGRNLAFAHVAPLA